MQILIVAGHNKTLYSQLLRFRIKSKNNLVVFGFVDNMHELMGVSDVIVTKAGGLTVSEALAKSLPIIIIAPIIGQETRNCEVLVDKGAGIKVNRVEELDGVVEQLLLDKDRFNTMKNNARQLGRPESAKNIVEIVSECHSVKDRRGG